MAIHFTAEQWEATKETYTKWWNRELDRPLLKITVPDYYEAEGEEPVCPMLTQENCNDFSFTAEQIIERFDYELSKKKFLYDSYPYINFDFFGPGLLTACCGAKLDNSSGRVWFFPEEIKEIEDITIKYDPENVWSKRVKEIYKAGTEKWQGKVIMGMPDLGGVMDAIAVFRESENLLFDLYDSPEEVQRLREEAEIAWKEAYLDFASVLNSKEYGYSDWSGIYCKNSSYIIQSDFCYMIGNEMFKEFVLPSLEDHVKFLDNTIYHLDGIGELNHLDDILALEELDAVQWIFGAGQPSAKHWIDSVYKKIEKSNKCMHIIENFNDLKDVHSEIKDNLYYQGDITKDEIESFELAVSQL